MASRRALDFRVVPLLGGNPLPRQQEPRTCEADGCTTKLSTYNLEPTCWTHTERRRPTHDVTGLRREAGERSWMARGRRARPQRDRREDQGE